MNESVSQVDLADIPANFRLIVHQFKKETGLSRTDIEVLTTLFALCTKGIEFRAPRELAKKLPTMSRDYLYDTISKLRNLGYIHQLREPFRNDSGFYRPGLYGCTGKGIALVNEFVREMQLIGAKTLYGE